MPGAGPSLECAKHRFTGPPTNVEKCWKSVTLPAPDPELSLEIDQTHSQAPLRPRDPRSQSQTRRTSLTSTSASALQPLAATPAPPPARCIRLLGNSYQLAPASPQDTPTSPIEFSFGCARLPSSKQSSRRTLYPTAGQSIPTGAGISQDNPALPSPHRILVWMRPFAVFRSSRRARRGATQRVPPTPAAGTRVALPPGGSGCSSDDARHLATSRADAVAAVQKATRRRAKQAEAYAAAADRLTRTPPPSLLLFAAPTACETVARWQAVGGATARLPRPQPCGSRAEVAAWRRQRRPPRACSHRPWPGASSAGGEHELRAALTGRPQRRWPGVP